MSLGFTLAFAFYLSNPRAPFPHDPAFSPYKDQLLSPAGLQELRRRAWSMAWKAFMQTGYGELLILPSLYYGTGEVPDRYAFSLFLNGFALGYVQLRHAFGKR
ncbi:MAG: hypothetical protein ACP5JV_08035 [Thermus sp.]|uniref:hypothetical protein n=1 Tax=Thermus sp. TaxID=275 RepID=UPI003D0A633C